MSDTGKDKKANVGNRLSKDAKAELEQQLAKFKKELSGNIGVPSKPKEAHGLGLTNDPNIDRQLAMIEKNPRKQYGQA